jgi:hypothetical protein
VDGEEGQLQVYDMGSEEPWGSQVSFMVRLCHVVGWKRCLGSSETLDALHGQLGLPFLGLWDSAWGWEVSEIYQEERFYSGSELWCL